MPSHERLQGEPNKEQKGPYLLAAKFEQERVALATYTKAQDTVFANECDLSVYRFKLRDVSHVAVLGSQPEPGLHTQLESILSAGEPTSLPRDVTATLVQRRSQARRIGPWVEGHYRPGRPM